MYTQTALHRRARRRIVAAGVTARSYGPGITNTSLCASLRARHEAIAGEGAEERLRGFLEGEDDEIIAGDQASSMAGQSRFSRSAAGTRPCVNNRSSNVAVSHANPSLDSRTA